jgi:DNA-binding transcriptional ArsR family regulator
VLKYRDATTEAEDVFHALSDPTRRRIVERLGEGPASVSQLAAPLPISLPAVVQHVQVLEASGLITSAKVGRVRTCRLVVKRLDTVQDWIDARRSSWERRLDRLGDYLISEAADKKEQS